MEGDQQSGDARADADQGRQHDQHRDVLRPEAGGDGRQHHQPDCQQRAQGVEPADEVQHHQRQEGQMGDATGAADRAQETGVDAFQHQRPVDQGEGQQRDGGDSLQQHQGGVIQRQHGAEQHVQQVDIRAFQGHQCDAESQRHEVERRQRCVLTQHRQPGNGAGAERHRKAGGHAPSRHPAQRQAAHKVAKRCTGQDRVGHGIADKAHPAQHQEHADRAGAERLSECTDQRPAHEREIGKGRDQRVVQHHGSRFGCQAAREQASAWGS